MGNFFDQFDPRAQQPAVPPAGGAGGNFFDQFDPAPVNPLSDVGQTALASVPRALADIAGFPVDFGHAVTQLGFDGVNAVTGKNYQVPEIPAWMPGSANIKNWASDATGVNLYNPQTDTGKALQPWMEGAAAAAIAGPVKAGVSVGGLLLKIGTNVLKYGVAPRAAGTLASQGAGALGASPQVQNDAGFVTALATGGLSAKAFDSPRPTLSTEGQPSVADLHAGSTAEYNAAAANNVGLTPTAPQTIADNLTTDLGTFKPNRNTPQTAAWIKDIADLKGQPSSISDIMDIRQGLSQVARDNVRPDGSVTADGALAHSVMDSLDNTLQNGLGPQDVTGGANPQDALSHWSAAGKSWAQMRQAQSIDNIFNKVLNSGLSSKGDQASALVNQFRIIANNPVKLNTYPLPVQQMITDLVRGTNTQRAEKYLSGFDVTQHPWSGAFASFLVNRMGNAVGVHGAGLAVPFAGGIATRMRNDRLISEAQQISNAVRGGQPVPPTPPVWPPRPPWMPGYTPAVMTAAAGLSVAQQRQQALAQALSAPQ